MNKLAEALYSIAVSLWFGGMCAIGYLAAPVLFHELSDRSLAGNLAGAMFTYVAYTGLVCGGYLLLYLLLRRGWRAIKLGVFWIVLAMLGLTVAGHFGIQPILAQLKIDAHSQRAIENAVDNRFATWHGISMTLYLLQSLLGLWLVVWQDRGKH